MASIKAVAYYRMSTDRQETSIADQRTAVEEYASKHGYKIVREYLDEGISGWKVDERKGFLQLIEDAEQRGDFQAVLCWDQDRFSRFLPSKAIRYLDTLNDAGVHVATCNQGRLNVNDFVSLLTATIDQHGKHQYCVDIARNTARGMKKLKLEGRWLASAPLGYRLVNGRLQIGEGVETVQRIFNLRASGQGCFVIARQLNESGTPTPRAAAWHAVSVRHILKNPVYIGHTVVGKNARGKHARVLDGVVTIEDTHPAIIDAATWATVCKMWETPGDTRHLWGKGAPLAGLVRCGRCGGTMYAASGNKYVCGTYRQGGGCGHCHVKRDSLLAAVALKIRDRVLHGSPKRLEAAIQRQLDRRQQPEPAAVSNARKLETLDRQIARAADRLLAVDDSLVADVELRLLELKRQRAKLAATISPPSKPLPSAKAIADKMWELERILREAAPATVRDALAQFVDHIRLDFNPVKTNYAGQSYRFAGGTIQLRTKGVQTGFLASWNDSELAQSICLP